MIRIAKWNETFENADSRKLVSMKWIQCPAGVSSSGYIELMSQGDDGLIALGVFLAICQWSATCRQDIRGSLARTDGRALSMKQIASHLRISEQTLRKAITLLSSDDVGWIECENTDLCDSVDKSASHPPVIRQSSADEIPQPPAYITGQDNTGQEITGEDTTRDLSSPKCLVEVLESFNEAFSMTCRMTKNRVKSLRLRLADAWWNTHWRDAIERGRQSEFLCGKNDRGWKMDFEFFLKPDTVTRILEGKYDNRVQSGRALRGDEW